MKAINKIFNLRFIFSTLQNIKQSILIKIYVPIMIKILNLFSTKNQIRFIIFWLIYNVICVFLYISEIDEELINKFNFVMSMLDETNSKESVEHLEFIELPKSCNLYESDIDNIIDDLLEQDLKKRLMSDLTLNL